MSTRSPVKPRLGFRGTATIALVTAVIVLLAGLAGAEVYARHRVSSCLSTQLSNEMNSRIEVGFGYKPLLLTWLDHKLPELTLTNPDGNLGQTHGMTMHMTFRDITMPSGSNQTTTIGSSSADILWESAGMVQSMNKTVSDIAPDPGTGTLQVKVLGGIGSLLVKPVVRNGQLVTDVGRAQVFGIGIPNDLAGSITTAFAQGTAQAPYGMHPTNVAVVDQGLQIHMEGGPQTLSAGSGGNSPGAQPLGSCS